MNKVTLYKLLNYISLLCLIQGFLIVGISYVEASNSSDYYVFTGNENNLTDNKNNWEKYSINLADYPLRYKLIGNEIPSINANIYFKDYNGNITFNLNDTFGDVFVLSSFDGNINIVKNNTVKSLSVYNGKIIIENSTLYVIGELSFSIVNEIDKIPQIPHRNYDIGLMFIILGASMPFIGFIVKYLKDKKEN